MNNNYKQDLLIYSQRTNSYINKSFNSIELRQYIDDVLKSNPDEVLSVYNLQARFKTELNIKQF